MRHFLLCCLANGILLSAANAQQTVSLLQQDSKTFLSCNDLSTVLGMEFKVVTPGKLATFCSVGADALCIPVRLNESNHRTADDDVFLLQTEAKSVLSLEVSVKDGKAHVIRATSDAAPTTTSGGFNSPWPEGRGFDVGQTVPDIPLIDMNGDEVRFGSYLGKRYILYCWASW